MLSNAQAGLRFLGQDDVAPEEIKNILVDIVAANKRASEVLGALRSMLRRQRTERAHFDIADAVRDVLGLLRSELTMQQVELETSPMPGCFVFADSTQIEQVLLNLVMNAIDAMDKEPLPHRRLRISVSRDEEGDVRVAVTDCGIGIPKEQFQKVFEAFWTTKGKGMGMGLSVCRAIIESHGGRIWVESNDDRGVTFYFKLPAPAEPQDSTALQSEEPPDTKLQ
jgi:signal transduction histidine kinase